MTGHSGFPPIESFDADPYRIASAYRLATGSTYRRDQQTWQIFRHADIVDILGDPAFLKDPSAANEGPYGVPLLEGDYSILFMDDPDHRRIRRLVVQAFSKRAAEAMRPRTQHIVDGLLADLEFREGPVDLIPSFAVPLPIIVIAEILGIDPTDRDDFKRWSDDMASSFDESLDATEAERVSASGREFRGYIGDVLASRRMHPQVDLISDLVAAQDDDGAHLSDDEAVSVIALLLFGGNTTTTDLIGNGVSALLRHPDQLAALRSGPSLIVNVVEEVLRYDTSITLAERIPTVPASIDDTVIPAGDWMCLLLSSANRDPAVHPDPDRFDIHRDPIHHVSFGGGRHYCLGAGLARMEVQVAIGSLAARFPRLRLVDPTAEPVYKSIPGFRGLSELPVLLE